MTPTQAKSESLEYKAGAALAGGLLLGGLIGFGLGVFFNKSSPTNYYTRSHYNSSTYNSI